MFKRIYWQVLLQKAIDNRTMMIGHPAFADLFHRLDQDGQELALLYLLLYLINNTHSIQVENFCKNLYLKIKILVLCNT